MESKLTFLQGFALAVCILCSAFAAVSAYRAEVRSEGTANGLRSVVDFLNRGMQKQQSPKGGK